MVKFAHIADVHLGGWKQEPMNELNFESFRRAINLCIENKLDFVLFAGDLFDSPYPPIDVLKDTFAELKKLSDAKIPVFLIAGSHDYSVSGKTFLDVLEKAGFCKNVFDAKNKENEIILTPHIHENIAIYGYPGKKSGLEVEDIKKLKLNDAPGMFKILMLHTTLDRVAQNLPIESVDSDKLPKVNYYALGHIHVLYDKDNFVYPGPLFPNNFKELEDLNHGHFVIVDTESTQQIQRINLPIKKIEKVELEIEDALTGTSTIIEELDKRNLEEKIVLLRIKGELKKGKIPDIKFQRIEEFIKNKNAYFFLKNTHDLKSSEEVFDIEINDSENIEEKTIQSFSKNNFSKLNKMIEPLMNALSTEKQEDEKTEDFTNRLFSESRKVLEF